MSKHEHTQESVEDLKKSIEDKNHLIRTLVTQNEELKKVKDNLARLVEMYDKLSKLQAIELADADNVVAAHEAQSALSTDEIKQIWSTVRAYESAADLARKELTDAYDHISAYEEVDAFTQGEVIKLQEELDDQIQAYEESDEFSQKEIMLLQEKLDEANEKLKELRGKITPGKS